MPSWTVSLLKRRRDNQDENEWQAVFTSALGHLRDPATPKPIYGRNIARTGAADLLESVDSPPVAPTEKDG